MTDLRGGIRAAAARLREAGVGSPEPDAVALAAHVLGVDVGEVRRLMVLGGRELPEAYAALVDERARRVPLQHLTGVAHFRRLTLAVGPGVFVPRPETEVLVDLALAELTHLSHPNAAFVRESGVAALSSSTNTAFGELGGGVTEDSGQRSGTGELGGGGPRVVDLCSGSGAIALAVKDEWPDAAVRGLEVSADAWAWATANRDRMGLDVDLVLGDATRPCFEDWAGTVDLVTVNPPYIPVGAVPVDPEVRDHDPDVALYGGSEDGLAIPLAVVAVAAGLLRPGGLALVEHADSQGESLPRRMRATGDWVEVHDHHDLSGRPRVTAARRGPRARD